MRAVAEEVAQAGWKAAHLGARMAERAAKGGSPGSRLCKVSAPQHLQAV